MLPVIRTGWSHQPETARPASDGKQRLGGIFKGDLPSLIPRQRLAYYRIEHAKVLLNVERLSVLLQRIR
ncbi:hypothetical protein [Gemmatimonas aurantiaca]|uniref:hypothetical protein n=1 Tax=Gemmatimonas aurantiaca TaxID=173480 RepID=UPI00301B8579